MKPNCIVEEVLTVASNVCKIDNVTAVERLIEGHSSQVFKVTTNSNIFVLRL